MIKKGLNQFNWKNGGKLLSDFIFFASKYLFDFTPKGLGVVGLVIGVFVFLKEEEPLKFDWVVEELFCWLFLFLKTIWIVFLLPWPLGLSPVGPKFFLICNLPVEDNLRGFFLLPLFFSNLINPCVNTNHYQ